MTIVGHSLGQLTIWKRITPCGEIADRSLSSGAAIALLDAVYLPLHLPGVIFKTVTYGMPRVRCQ